MGIRIAPRIVLFGGGGFVGGNLAVVAARQGWEVHVADTNPASLPQATWHELSATDETRVRGLLEGLRPAAVVDLAAIADIDLAERERDLARAVNVEAARVVARASREVGAWCLYFSSDAVFDGSRVPYAEDDPTRPLSYYGRTKVEGELAVREADPTAAVIRVSLALGFPVTRGNSFLATLAARLERGEEIRSPRDEVRTPVDVLTLSECVLELATMRYAGVLHVGSTDSMDRETITHLAARLLGYAARINGEPAAQTPGRAPRHKNGIMDVTRARRLLTTPLLDSERTVRRAVMERLA